MHACVSYYTLSLLRKRDERKFHAGQEESFLIGGGRGSVSYFLYAGIQLDC